MSVYFQEVFKNAPILFWRGFQGPSRALILYVFMEGVFKMSL
nr:MAG TPA: hypothetical protein [Caudoviricetes sp.]